MIVGIALALLVGCSTQVQPPQAKPTTPSSSSSSSSASSNPPVIHVGPRFAINEFIVDFPADWTLITRDKIENIVESYDIMDASGNKVASLRCPIREAGYEGWDFKNQSRKFQKNGIVYGADLWIGTPWAGAEDNGPLHILLFHRNDFGHWAEDEGHSCEIISFKAGITANMMETIYKSVR